MGVVPNHTCGYVNIIVRNTLIIRLIDVAQVNNRVAHFFFAAFDVSIDDAIDSRVAECVYMHCQAVCISLARNFRNFFFRPVDNPLMTVEINGINKTRAAFYGAVHKKFYPIRFKLIGSIFFESGGVSQFLINIHPAVNFVSRAKYEIHLSRLVKLICSPIINIVKEIT